MQNNTLMLNNIFLEEIIKSKLVNDVNIYKKNKFLNEHADFFLNERKRLTKVQIEHQIYAATKLQQKINSSRPARFLDTPEAQLRHMTFRLPTQAAINNKPKADRGKYFLPWIDTVADSFFNKLVLAGNRKVSGIYRNLIETTNPNQQAYSYQILMISDSGKTRTYVDFHPNGTCNIADEGSLEISGLRYKIESNKLHIYVPESPSVWAIEAIPNSYYLIAKFNPALDEKVYDPYEGVGFWKSAFLDVQGYRDANKWATTKKATQAKYNNSISYWADILQTIGDWAGLIPGYGDAIDIVNALIYFGRGKRTEGLLSLIAVVPVVGSIIKLGVKNGFKMLKYGNKVGIDVLEDLATSTTVRKIVGEWLNKNKIARDNLKLFVKNIGKAKTWRNAATKLIKVLRWIPGAGIVADALENMMKSYGKQLDAYIVTTGETLGQFLAKLDKASDLAKAGGKASKNAAADEIKDLTAAELKVALLKRVSTNIFKNKNGLQRFFLKILGEPWWDTVSRSMASQFMKWVSKLSPAEIVSLANASPSGFGKIIKAMAGSNIDTIVKYIKESGVYQIPAGASNHEIWNYVAAKAMKSPEEMEKLVKLFTKALAGKPDVYIDMTRRLAVDLITSGNAIYKVWCQNFWNFLKSILAWNVYKNAEKTGYIFKYGAHKQPGIGNISGWIEKNMLGFLGTNQIGSAIRKLLTWPLRIIENLGNLKRLDIYWNELSDFFDKTTSKEINTPDAKQGVVLSAFGYWLGSTPFDIINYFLNIGKAITPTGVIPKGTPTDRKMIKNKEFNTPLNSDK
jgi:hypothetical protein